MKLFLLLLLLFAPVLAQERRELKSSPVMVVSLEEIIPSSRPTTSIKIKLYNFGDLAIKSIMFDIGIVDANRGGEVDKIRGLLGDPKGKSILLKPNQSKTIEHDLNYYAPNGWLVNDKSFRFRNIVFADNSMWINPDIEKE
jgi:hypothetical protein